MKSKNEIYNGYILKIQDATKSLLRVFFKVTKILERIFNKIAMRFAGRGGLVGYFVTLGYATIEFTIIYYFLKYIRVIERDD